MSGRATLAVCNQKGGVGKTTVAINLAGALNARGADVLLVDLDPQGNATENLGMRQCYDAQPPSLFNVLSDAEQRSRIADLIESHPEMDLLPSNIDMTAIEPELTLARQSGKQLAFALETLPQEYDFILLDCPPFLGHLMDNALYAAQNIVIPALAEPTSKRAFELLFDHIAALQRDYGIRIREHGVVINRIDVRKAKANEMIAWIEDAFDDTPVWCIRERAAIQRSFEAGATIFEAEPDCDQLPTFERIAGDLQRRFRRGEVSA